jgi:hypothetical protein
MTDNRRFIPYNDAHKTAADDLIVVDCYYHRGLNLTHLYSERVPHQYRSDSSTETVIRWQADTSTEKPGGNAANVTCNHFDIDGLLSVWCVLNPEIALAHRDLLIAAANLGDFREFDPSSETGLQALKLCAILNAVEASEFCLPFGDLENATIEYQVSIRKFEYFLPRLAGWLLETNSFENLWRKEYDEVLTDTSYIKAGNATIAEYRDPKITVVTSPKPLHFYAVCSNTQGGAILTDLPASSYCEFEYRYETAVGRLGKEVLERKDLTTVKEELNRLETYPNVHWECDNLYEGGWILRPEYIDKPLSREDLYQNISYRMEKGLVPKTSISGSVLLELVLKLYGKEKEHRQTAYALSDSQ